MLTNSSINEALILALFLTGVGTIVLCLAFLLKRILFVRSDEINEILVLSRR